MVDSESEPVVSLCCSRNSLPKDLLRSSAVLPLTCPAKMLPTVLKMTSASFCVGILLAVVPYELALVLGSEDYGHLVASCRGNEVVQTFDEDGRKLVQKDPAGTLPFVVDELEHP